MKFKTELGSPAVRDLIERACARASELPPYDFGEPWPSSPRKISDSFEPATPAPDSARK